MLLPPRLHRGNTGFTEASRRLDFPSGATSLCQLHPLTLGLDPDPNLYPYPTEVGLGVVASLPVSKREEPGLQPTPPSKLRTSHTTDSGSTFGLGGRNRGYSPHEKAAPGPPLDDVSAHDDGAGCGEPDGG